MKKRITVILLAFAITICFIPFEADSAYAFTYGATYDGSMCTGNAGAASTIDYLMKKYPHQGKYKGAGQCWGYAEKICSTIASARTTKYYKGYTFTAAHFKAKCLGAKAGTHIRLSRASKFSGGYGHSVALLMVADDLVYWTDGNYDSNNGIEYCSGTVDDFCNMYGQYGYINMVSKPTKYRTFAVPKSYSSYSVNSGDIAIGWLKTSGAKRYDIYRSYSKNGKYRKIASTKKIAYDDTSVALGAKAYYKVRAIKRTTKPYSNVSSGLSRLGRPMLSGAHDDNGYISFSWSFVDKASSYVVYRCTDSYVGNPKFDVVATTTDNSYIDTSATDPYNQYVYKVKAIYSSNAKANSVNSTELAIYFEPPAPAAPVISGSIGANGKATLNWNSVSGATSYVVYRSEEKDEGFELIDHVNASSGQLTYTDNDRDGSSVYYYRVCAVGSFGQTGDDSNVLGL